MIFCFKYKINEVVNTFLVVGDKFMPEIHLKQPGFTYSACGPFTKNNERIKNLETLEIQVIFAKLSWIKRAFNMIGLMEILKI